MIMNNGYLNYSSLVLDVSDSLFFRFPDHNLVCILFCISPTCVTCTTHIIFLDSNSFIIFGAWYTESAMPFLLTKKEISAQHKFQWLRPGYTCLQSLKFVNDKQENLEGTQVDNITMGHKQTDMRVLDGLIWLMIQSKSGFLWMQYGLVCQIKGAESWPTEQ